MGTWERRFAPRGAVTRALAGRIPRAFKSHKTPDGAAYGTYVRAKLERLGPLPDDARPLLREAGRLVIDLDRLRRDLEAAVARKHRSEARRIDRRLVPMRTQLLTLEARLEELARGNHGARPTPAELMGQMREAGELGDGDE